jgi:hypothetical protein
MANESETGGVESEAGNNKTTAMVVPATQHLATRPETEPLDDAQLMLSIQETFKQCLKHGLRDSGVQVRFELRLGCCYPCSSAW